MASAAAGSSSLILFKCTCTVLSLLGLNVFVGFLEYPSVLVKSAASLSYPSNPVSLQYFAQIEPSKLILKFKSSNRTSITSINSMILSFLSLSTT